MTEGWNVFEHAERTQPAPEKRGWLITPMIDSAQVHVIPVQDGMDHVWSESCACGPDLVESGSDRVRVLHKAQDGREDQYE